MDLFSRKAKDILIEGTFDEYEQGMKFFYRELVKLNANIYIINKVRQFPFDLFCTPDETIFFSMVLYNFLEYSIVMIHRMVNDRGSDVITLPRFKNRINDFVRQEFKSEFLSNLKRVKFDKTMKDILKRVEDLRHKLIGHFVEEFAFNIKNVDRINIEELEKLCDAFNSLLNALAFNVEYLMLPLPYSDKVKRPPSADSRSDIEKILEFIARDSGMLNLIEDQWKRNSMSEKEIRIFNKYRKKFGLPEV